MAPVMAATVSNTSVIWCPGPGRAKSFQDAPGIPEEYLLFVESSEIVNDVVREVRPVRVAIEVGKTLEHAAA